MKIKKVLRKIELGRPVYVCGLIRNQADGLYYPGILYTIISGIVFDKDKKVVQVWLPKFNLVKTSLLNVKLSFAAASERIQEFPSDGVLFPHGTSHTNTPDIVFPPIPPAAHKPCSSAPSATKAKRKSTKATSSESTLPTALATRETPTAVAANGSSSTGEGLN